MRIHRGQPRRHILVLLVLSSLLAFFHGTYVVVLSYFSFHDGNRGKSGSLLLPLKSPPDPCTANDKETIRRQLPPEDCIANDRAPWNNKCSFSYATRCPDATHWLNDDDESNRDDSTVVSIYVGCNKAMDAVATLRRTSRDPSIDRDIWRDTLITDKMNMNGLRKGSMPARIHAPEFRRRSVSFQTKGCRPLPRGHAHHRPNLGISCCSVTVVGPTDYLQCGRLLPRWNNVVSQRQQNGS